MTNKSNRSTAKEFSVHPALIYSLITKQASGAPKALLELVMNSVDAGATRIDVTLDKTGYVIADNGKGFKNKEEVTAFFGTFGTPHAEGDAFYGRFRLGRAQSFGISKTKWFSKDFCMAVDLKVDLEMDDKEAPLGYAVSEGHEFYQGCKIVGEFYNPQNVGSVADFFRASVGERPEEMPIIPALIKMIRYIPCDVYINGEKVNASIEESPVSHATDTAHFILSKNEGTNIINIYNKGVYAYQLPSEYYSGDVVSIDTLDLNIARNEAKHNCPIAKKIKNKIKAIDIAVDNASMKKKDVNERIVDNKGYIDGVWEVFLGMKAFDKDAVDNLIQRKVIKLANDKKMSFKQIATLFNKTRPMFEGDKVNQFVVYDFQKLTQDQNQLDLMSLENGFIPVELFPSEDVLKKLNYEVTVLIEFCRENYVNEGQIKPTDKAYADYKKFHCFDFSQAETTMDKYRLLIGLFMSFFYAIEGMYKFDGKLFYQMYKENYYSGGIKPLRELAFDLVDINDIPSAELSTRVDNLVQHNVQLNDIEKMVLSALSSNVEVNRLGRGRKLFVVSTDSQVLAYTDGKSSISFNHSFLQKCIEQGDFEELVLTLIHEMCHNSKSLGKASHGATFYAEFVAQTSKCFMGIMVEFYDWLGQKIEKRVDSKGVDWLSEQVPVDVLRKIAKHRLNNKVRAFA